MENRVWQVETIIGGPEKAQALFAESKWPWVANLFVDYVESVELQRRDILDRELPLEAAIFAAKNAHFGASLTEDGHYSLTAVEGVRVPLSDVVAQYGAGFAEEIYEKGSNHPSLYRPAQPATATDFPDPGPDRISSVADAAALVDSLINIDVSTVDRSAKEFPEIEGFYLSENIRGGRAVVVGYDGTVLFAESSGRPSEHRQAFADGKRTPLEHKKAQ